MNDDPRDDQSAEHDFEAELRQLRPRPASRELTDRIAQQLDAPPTTRAQWSRADRCLASFMTSGALAACWIVGLLTWQMWIDRAHPSSPSSPSVAIAEQRPPPSLGEYQQALARSNEPTLELLR